MQGASCWKDQLNLQRGFSAWRQETHQYTMPDTALSWKWHLLQKYPTI
jgi:hypothetical protein